MERLFPKRAERLVKYVRRRRPAQQAAEILSLAKTGGAQSAAALEKPVIAQLFSRVTGSVEEKQSDRAVDGAARGAFKQLIAETPAATLRIDAPAAADTVARVDALLDALRSRTAPVVPRADLINEALRVYVGAGEMDKAEGLVGSMGRSLGVKPNDQSWEHLASGYLRIGRAEKARQLMERIGRVSEVGHAVVHSLIVGLLKRDRDAEAWQLFDDLRSKCLPTPAVAATMIFHCGRGDQVERALVLYKELAGQGMTANARCHSALIYAASKRREYFSHAIDLFRQMELFKMRVDLRVYNNLLYGCSKVSDLPTAMSLWRAVVSQRDAALRPNEHTCCNYLLALASVETAGDKISKRAFHYSVSPQALKVAAQEVWEYAGAAGIAVNAHLVSAMLAVYSNHRMTREAEELFWGRGGERTPFAYELMFKLYDSTRNYPAALRTYAQLRLDRLKLPYEGWRALARAAALCNQLEDSIGYVEEMVRHDYTPHHSDMRVLHLRYCEHERRDLVDRLQAICKREPVAAPDRPAPWLDRSVAVAELLKQAYGKDAPELASRKAEQRE